MTENEHFVTTPDGKDLFLRVMKPHGESPKALVLIIHGLGEHSGRYLRFAEYLTERSYAVAAYDHRGHGQSDPDDLGFIPGDDGFHQMVDDLAFMAGEISSMFPGLPQILFAHSMGSFVTQRFLQLHKTDAAGVIYSGSNGKPPALIYAGRLLARLIAAFKGDAHRSDLMRNITFAPYNSRFKPTRTRHDWLSRDPDEVDGHVNDPLCGFTPSASFFVDFFSGLITLHKHEPFSGRQPNTPLMIISGSKDPVSAMGTGIKRLKQKLRTSGESKLTVVEYKNARHELLNEINRDEVMNDILNWIENVVEATYVT